MATHLRIREAHAHDRDLLADWAIAMAWETEHKKLDPDTVRRGVALGVGDPARARYFIAEIDGQPAGTLMLTTEWSDWRNGQWWWIQSVYVPPEHRRKGVFSALYRHVEAMAKDTPGVIGLRLCVERENENAQRTYASLGMEDEGYKVFHALLAVVPGFSPARE